MTLFKGARNVKLVIAMLVACVAFPADAQTASDSALVRALSRFRPGQPVQVALMRNRWSGEFRRVGGDTLFFGTRNDSSMALRFNAIDTLWRRSSHSVRGAWIVGTAGALFGGFTFAVVAGQADDIDASAMEAGALGVVAGGAVGAIAGGLIGSGFRRWRRVYP